MIASVSKIRYTVRALIGLPRARRTRAVTSATDCRLRGCAVSATASQATALTKAWSSGGKSGLAAPPGGVRQRKITSRPGLARAADLVAREAHALAGLRVAAVRLLVQEQGVLTALDGLVRGGLATDCVAGPPQELFRKDREEGGKESAR